MWAASSEFLTYLLCEQRRVRRACASAQSRQNLRCSLIQAVSHEEPSDRKPDTWPLWMAGHAQLKFVMTECSKTQIRLTGLMWQWKCDLSKGRSQILFFLYIGPVCSGQTYFWFRTGLTNYPFVDVKLKTVWSFVLQQTKYGLSKRPNQLV